MRTSRVLFAFTCLSLLLFSSGAAQNKDYNDIEIERRPLGPVVKFAPLALAHHYSKLLFGIEYFITPKISLQHKGGPIVLIDNYKIFDESEYDKFRGWAIDNEIRYYVYHNYEDVYEYDFDNTVKALYSSLEFNYSYTTIDSYIVETVDCGENCYYYRKTDATFGRRWAGIAAKMGLQFAFKNNFTIDFNGGLGIRRLWVEEDYSPSSPDAYINDQGIDFAIEEYFPYMSISVLIGYNLM